MRINDCIINYLNCNKDNTILDKEQRSMSQVALINYYIASDEDINCEKFLKSVDQWSGTQLDIDSRTGIFQGSTFNFLKVLYYSFLKTKKGTYKESIELFMNQINSEYPLEWNNFWQSNNGPVNVVVDRLYMAGPFYMAYETAFHNKEYYNEIVTKFISANELVENEFSLKVAAKYATAVIDTMDFMSKEIFEHYKMLERSEKTMIQMLIQHIEKEKNSIYQAIDKGNIDEDLLEDLANVAYVIIKACRMKVVLTEKYLATGMELFDKVLKVVYDTGNQELKWSVDHNQTVIAMIAMAYAEKLKLES